MERPVEDDYRLHLAKQTKLGCWLFTSTPRGALAVTLEIYRQGFRSGIFLFGSMLSLVACEWENEKQTMKYAQHSLANATARLCPPCLYKSSMHKSPQSPIFVSSRNIVAPIYTCLALYKN